MLKSNSTLGTSLLTGSAVEKVIAQRSKRGGFWRREKSCSLIAWPSSMIVENRYNYRKGGAKFQLKLTFGTIMPAYTCSGQVVIQAGNTEARL